MRTGRIGQHQRVLVGRVDEEVGDALVLQQAVDEVEVALAVLHAVGPGRVAAGQPILDVHLLAGMLVEDRPHDLGHGLLLEDPAVGGAAQEPEPWPQRGPVARLVALVADEREPADQPVEAALAAAQHVDLDRHAGAEQVGEARWPGRRSPARARSRNGRPSASSPAIRRKRSLSPRAVVSRTERCSAIVPTLARQARPGPDEPERYRHRRSKNLSTPPSSHSRPWCRPRQLSATPRPPRVIACSSCPDLAPSTAGQIGEIVLCGLAGWSVTNVTCGGGGRVYYRFAGCSLAKVLRPLRV